MVTDPLVLRQRTPRIYRTQRKSGVFGLDIVDV
jgi:hypothetical protein